MHFKVNTIFDTIENTARIDFYDHDDNILSTFFYHNIDHVVNVSGNEHEIEIDLESFKFWIKKAMDWYRQILADFPQGEYGNDNPFGIDVELKNNGIIVFNGKVGGKNFSGNYDPVSDNVTLDHHNEMNLSMSEFKIFLAVHTTFIEAIKGRLPIYL